MANYNILNTLSPKSKYHIYKTDQTVPTEFRESTLWKHFLITPVGQCFSTILLINNHFQKSPILLLQAFSEHNEESFYYQAYCSYLIFIPQNTRKSFSQTYAQ